MMAAVKFAKVVASLPATLDPDTMYMVRAGAGFDLYVSDTTGSMAHSLNDGPGGGAQVPVGTMVRWPSPTPPAGWLRCDGAAFTETQYPLLYAALAGHPAANNVLVANPYSAATDIIPTMTSDTAPSGLATASSINSATYAAWRAFDKNVSTANNGWITATGVLTGVLRYYFPAGTVRAVTHYSIRARVAATANCPRTWTFRGLRNGVWVPLDIRAAQPAFAATERREYQLSAAAIREQLNGMFEAFEIDVVESQAQTGGGNSYLAIGEMEIFGGATLTPFFSSPPAGTRLLPTIAPSPAGQYTIIKAG